MALGWQGSSQVWMGTGGHARGRDQRGFIMLGWQGSRQVSRQARTWEGLEELGGRGLRAGGGQAAGGHRRLHLRRCSGHQAREQILGQWRTASHAATFWSDRGKGAISPSLKLWSKLSTGIVAWKRAAIYILAARTRSSSRLLEKVKQIDWPRARPFRGSSSAWLLPNNKPLASLPGMTAICREETRLSPPPPPHTHRGPGRALAPDPPEDVKVLRKARIHKVPRSSRTAL